MRKTIKLKDMKVTFQDDPETHKTVYNLVLNWYLKHQAFSGESIMQNDDTQIEAPVLLSDLADDVFNFDVEWDDDL